MLNSLLLSVVLGHEAFNLILQCLQLRFQSSHVLALDLLPGTYPRDTRGFDAIYLVGDVANLGL